MKNSKQIWLILAITDTLVIIILSLLSQSTIQKYSILELTSMDKFGHFVFYGFAAFSYCLYVKINRLKISYPFCKIFLALFSMGLFLEIVQSVLAQGRTFDYLDQIANSLGALCGIFFCSRFAFLFDSIQELND